MQISGTTSSCTDLLATPSTVSRIYTDMMIKIVPSKLSPSEIYHRNTVMVATLSTPSAAHPHVPTKTVSILLTISTEYVNTYMCYLRF